MLEAAAEESPAAVLPPRASLLPPILHLELYIARCSDSGLRPTVSGARRFQKEVAVAAGETGGVRLNCLMLGPKCAEFLSRSCVGSKVVLLHGNPGLSDMGAAEVLPLLNGGTVTHLDLGACSLTSAFAPALARHLLRAPGAGSSLERLELGGSSGFALQRPNQLRGLAALAAVLQQVAPRLSALGLSHNAIR